VNPLELLDEFSKFCRVDLQLAKETIERYKGIMRCFLKWFPKDLRQATREDLRNYMLENYSDSPPNSRSNIIRGFRCFYRSFLGSPITDSFRYPRAPFIPKEAPSTEKMRLFYDALTKPVHKLMFLLLATSGLREMEILSLRYEDLDISRRAIIPKNHEGSTKKSWCSFYSPECDQLLQDHLAFKKTWQGDEQLFHLLPQGLRHVFEKASRKCEFKIKPKDLRDWFADKMGSLGVQDRYVDAFQGRAPKSILARHYSDFRVDKMKIVYESANLRLMEGERN
jgi:integrase